MSEQAISGLHPIFSSRVYQGWDDLESEIIKIESTKEKGDAFEQFCYLYFLYHKELYLVEEIWCDKIRGREIPKEIREKYKLEITDYGVDGVNRLSDGRIEAWQAKFRSDRSSATARELATFWTEAEYCDLKRTISNTTKLPDVADKKMNHEYTLLDRFIDLDAAFFQAVYDVANNTKATIKPEKYVPRPHQQAMLQDVISGLKENNRGKLIAACGVGKTLVALWVSESKELNASTVLVLAPSISLVGQTVREWVEHGNSDFEYLCVCSDQSIVSDIEEFEEESDISVDDLDFSVTTNSKDVVSWLKATAGKRQYIFSTYHSIPVIEEALKEMKDFSFDLGIFDEAHRTVGRHDQFFARGLSDENIRISKRLFMTATERLVNPAVKTLAKNSGVEVFSMDDQAKYGPTLHDFNFGKAIQAGVIADYEIILAMVGSDEDLNAIKQNAIVFLDDEQTEKVTLSAELLFKAAFLTKALTAVEIQKVITFHSSQKNAKAFNKALDLIEAHRPYPFSKPYFTYVLGYQNNAERSVRISNFESAERGVLGNVQVLSEGVDIPLVDSIYFVDPKNSLIDIVQGIGRALRKKPSVQKTAKIIVPVIISEEIESLDQIEWDDALATFHSVIQAMRDQDEVLREEINQINEYAVTKGKSGHHISTDSSSGTRLRAMNQNLVLPKGIKLEDFLNRISLRVASANGNATGAKLAFSHLGKGERKSEYKPIFGILGDYNPEPYRDSCVLPTIEKFTDGNPTKKRKELAVNHNNVSHAERIGVIRPVNKDEFELTALGKKLMHNQVSFEDLFKNQMMLFSHNGIFSYRAILEMLQALKSLSHIEFLFGPYVIQNPDNISAEISAAVKRIETIRAEFPNLDMANISNRDPITLRLNEISPVQVPFEDIWSDRTTPKNKFRYLANSMTLFDVFDERKEGFKEPISIKAGAEEAVAKILENSDPLKAKNKSFYGEWWWLD